jgi:LacI family transcriptional regulator
MKGKENFITINEVAKAAGVSRATVGRVVGNYGIVSESSRKKVEEAIKELDYVPNALAQGMRNKATKIIAIVVGSIKNNFFSEIIHAIEQKATENNFNLIICNSQEDIEKEVLHLKSLYSRRIDGIIIAPAYTSDRQIRHENLYLYGSAIPIVFIDRRIENFKKTLIRSDNLTGSYEAAKHLISLGHRNIGMVSTKNYTTVNDRILGYKKALAEAKLEFKKSYLESVNYENNDLAGEAVEKILSENKEITALIVLNDNLISGILYSLKKLNLKIPEDISIISWDENEITKLFEITTVAQQADKIGALAVENIFQMINEKGNSDVHEVILKTQLIERNSCRKIKN